MSNELLASKTVIREEDPKLRTIQPVPTAVAAFIGIAERGPLGVATLVTSWDEYVKIFGYFTANSEMALAVFGFFHNGGSQAYIVRTTHYVSPTNPATKTSAAATGTLTTSGAATAGAETSTGAEPFNLDNGDTLVVDVNGLGAPIPIATFTAAAPTEASTLGAGAGFPTGFVGGEVLNVTVNGVAQVVTFGAGDQTADDVALAINTQLSAAKSYVSGGEVVIETDEQGSGVTLQITGGTANATLAFPTGLVTGTGNVVNIDGVTGAEIKTIVELAVAGCTVTTDGAGLVTITSNAVGAGSSIQVDASSTADSKIGFDNALHSGTPAGAGNTATIDGKYDGLYGDGVSVEIADATSGVAGEFNLIVYEDGVFVAVYPNLSMDPTSASYVEDVVNSAATGSQLITFTDLLAGTPPANRPDNQTITLSGGDDGLVGLVDADFSGSELGPTGIRCLDTIEDIRLLAVPGRANGVHQAMITYCDNTRGGSMEAVLDPAAGQTAQNMVDYVEAMGAPLLNLSEFGGIYWPRIKILNPSVAVFGSDETIDVYPSGHICGMMARVDASKDGGVYESPAGETIGRLIGAVGVETDEVLDEGKRDLVYPKRINPITTGRGLPVFVDGGRTLKGDGNFPNMGERRGMIFIEQSIKAGTAYARHRNNDKTLRRRVDRSVTSFLITQMNHGAFRSTDPETAFFVDVSDELNPPSEIFANRLNGKVGCATQKPAEFIVFTFTQDTRGLEEELAAS